MAVVKKGLGCALGLLLVLALCPSAAGVALAAPGDSGDLGGESGNDLSDAANSDAPNGDMDGGASDGGAPDGAPGGTPGGDMPGGGGDAGGAPGGSGGTPGGDMPGGGTPGDSGGAPGGGGGMGGTPGGGSYLSDDLSYGVDADGTIVAPNTTGTDYTTERTLTSDSGFVGSFGGGGKTSTDDDYAFVCGILAYDGNVTELPHLDLSRNGTSASVTSSEADNVSLISKWAGFNPIVVYNSEYTVNNADISQYTSGDGSETSDFSGLGAGIAAYGSDTNLLVENSTVGVSGAGNLGLFVDNGAFVTVRDSAFASYGGTLYSDYVNSADQSTMCAPPWILGIMGTSRLSNLEGVNTTLNFLDSEAISSQWAILSTDASDGGMYLNVANSTLKQVGQGTTDGNTFGSYSLQEDNDNAQLSAGALAGDTTLSSNPYTYRAGYGTYTIGDTTSENFYGTTMSVGTFANIFTGGNATYTCLTSGETVDLGTNSASFSESYTYDYLTDEFYDANSEQYTTDTNGNVVKRTVIDSDTVGFMCHQGSNNLTLSGGTVVSAPYYIFEHRTGGNLTVDISDGVDLRSGSNILVQVENNDDSTTGGAAGGDMGGGAGGTGDMGAGAGGTGDMGGGAGGTGGGAGGAGGTGDMGGGAGGTGGGAGGAGGTGGMGGGGGFATTHTENSGWPTQSRSAGNSASVYNVTNSNLVGNVFNASGWAGNSSDSESAVAVTIDLSDESTLTGQISSTKAVHVSKEGMDFVSDYLNGKAYVEGTTHSNTILSYQNTEFGIDEYYDIGMVANAVAAGSGNTIDVVVDDTSAWNVTATGVVHDVTLASEKSVAMDADADANTTVYYTGTLTLDGTGYTDNRTVNGVDFVHGTPDPANEEGVDSWAGAVSADINVIGPRITVNSDFGNAIGAAGNAGYAVNNTGYAARNADAGYVATVAIVCIVAVLVIVVIALVVRGISRSRKAKRAGEDRTDAP